MLNDWSLTARILTRDRSNYDLIESLKVKLADVIEKDLTEKQREVIELYWFDRLTQQQIADELGISKQNVNKRLQLAYTKIKTSLQPLLNVC